MLQTKTKTVKFIIYPAAFCRKKKVIKTTHTFKIAQTHHHCSLLSLSFNVPYWFEGGGDYINYAFYWLTDENLALLNALFYFPFSLGSETRECYPCWF